MRYPRLAAAILLLVFLPQPLVANDWEPGPGYRKAKLQPPPEGKDGFTLLSPDQTGISFTNFLSEERALASQILPSGSGVAAGDVDSDGWCDLYFCGLKTGNRLYRNLGGWKFEDITARAGVGCTNLDATGAAFVDVNGDGALDLIVNSLGGGTHLFFNDGKGRFTESKQVLNLKLGGMSLGFADFDGDGWPDLYIANYRVETIADRPDVRFNLRTVDGRLTVASINGKPLTDPEWTNRFRYRIADDGKGSVKFSHEELGEPDALYRNLGGGKFEQVPWTSGAFLDENGKPLAEPPFDWGLSVMFRDLNGDSKPDLYVCNDFATPDRIWINDGKGHFRALARTAMRQTPLSSMAVDVADINRDGFDDLFVGDMLSRDHRRRLVQRTNLRPEVLPLGAIDNRPQYARNMVQLNRGDGTYAEIAQLAGLEASEWSWTPVFLDVDLDGYEDLLVANGFVRDNMNLDALDAIRRSGPGASIAATMQFRKKFPRLATPKVAFRNLDGLNFVETGHQWGFDTPAISQGMCAADLDHDGDLDLVVNNLNSVAGVYRNDSARPRLAVLLKGTAPNTGGIGAKIRVYGGPVPVQSQEIVAGGRYLSSDQPIRTFAAGTNTSQLRIEVDWPPGKRSVVSNASPNFVYEIDEAGAEPSPASRETNSALPRPWFEDVSHLLSHTHQETPFDDFALQAALAKRLSQLGPGVCWCDLNGDGHEDLAIPSGKGGSLALFFGDGKGGFQRHVSAPPQPSLERDQAAVLAWLRSGNKPLLLVASSNYEDGQTNGAAVDFYDPESGAAKQAVPSAGSSAGPMALGDLDGDGNLDLFVGARVNHGNYPTAGPSHIYRIQNGRFVPDQANDKALESVGMVSGAVFSDLDGDGFPELILACEWGPLRIFHNDHGRLTPTNSPLTFRSQPLNSQPSTLNDLTGWWNGVTTGDLDGDGRPDIIASNWGQNSKYQSHRAAPLRLYFSDVNQDGALALVEAFFEPQMRKYVPERRLDVIAESMPFLRGRFPTYQSFAEASVDEIFGDRMPQVGVLEATCLESTVFFNRGGSFEATPLPWQAQLAPAFAVIVADYDGDGAEDLFLSQNFFAVEPETSRYDAGRGLWLKGDGHGEVTAVPGPESGITVYGEQRGAAVADYDGDGRVDLVVTQNGAETKLFKNLRARPGLRVRLEGPPGNPQGIGAQLRVKHGDVVGPVREIHAGSGYWSQDSAIQVLATGASPAQLWIRWPGGKSFCLDVPPGSTEVLVSANGTIARVR